MNQSYPATSIINLRKRQTTLRQFALVIEFQLIDSQLRYCGILIHLFNLRVNSGCLTLLLRFQFLYFSGQFNGFFVNLIKLENVVILFDAL